MNIGAASYQRVLLVEAVTTQLIIMNEPAAFVFGAVELAIIVAIIAGFWKVFVKAGKPGWAAIIPIYNAIVLLQIAGKPLWWILLFFIPLVNIIMAIIVSIAIAKNFGKSDAFGIGLALLGFIFYPILGFGDAQYQGNKQ